VSRHCSRVGYGDAITLRNTFPTDLSFGGMEKGVRRTKSMDGINARRVSSEGHKSPEEWSFSGTL